MHCWTTARMYDTVPEVCLCNCGAPSFHPYALAVALLCGGLLGRTQLDPVMIVCEQGADARPRAEPRLHAWCGWRPCQHVDPRATLRVGW